MNLWLLVVYKMEVNGYWHLKYKKKHAKQNKWHLKIL